MAWGLVLQEYFTHIIPQLVFNIAVALLLVILGIALGFVVKGIVVWILKLIRFEDIISALKLHHLFGKLTVSEVAGDVTEALIILAFIIQGLYQLKLTLVANALMSFMLWVPNLLAGFLVFLLFFVLAKFVEGIIMGSGHGHSEKVALYTNIVILVFGGVTALRQMGFNTYLVEQVIIITVIGFALAFALAVGIGMGLGLKDEAQALVTSKRAKTVSSSSSSKKSSRRKKR